MSSEEPEAAPEQSDLFKQVAVAISNDDLETLRGLIQPSPENAAYFDRNRNGHLYFSIHINKYEAFTYLLSLDHYDAAAINLALKYSLDYDAFDPTDTRERYSLYLIDRSPSLDYLDDDNNTFLHFALKRHAFQAARMLIDRGADIDARNDAGCTPFHVLFHQKTDIAGIEEGAALMLYHGADASIPDDNGNLPFDLAVIYDKSLATTQETLLLYTFDEYSEYRISCEVLFELLDSGSALFFQVSDFVRDVIFHRGVSIRPDFFLAMRPEFLRVVIDKFSSVISRVFSTKMSIFWYEAMTSQNWEALLDSCVAAAVVQFIGRIRIEYLIEKLIEDGRDAKVIHDLIFYLLSYGLNVWAKDLDTVYTRYGYCFLFKTLLHMDIRGSMCDVVPRIIIDARFDLDRFLDDPHNFSLIAFTELLGYFARPRLRNHRFMCGVEAFVRRAAELPNVPSLTEFARDAARKFLVERFAVETSRQFHWMLNRLPVGVYQKRILSFEAKLY